MSPDPIPGWLLIRPDAVVAAADDAACNLLGAPSSDAIAGRVWTELIHPDDFGSALEAERLRLSGQPWQGALRLDPGGAMPGPVDVELTPVEASGGMSALRLTAHTPAIATHAGSPGPAEMHIAALEALEETEELQAAARSVLQVLSTGLPFDWGVVLRFRGSGPDAAGAEVVAVYPSPLAGLAPGAHWSGLDGAEAAVLASGEPAITTLATARDEERSPLRRLAGYGLGFRLHVPLFSRHGAGLVEGGAPVAGCAILYRRAGSPFDAMDGVRAERALARLGDRLERSATSTPSASAPAEPGGPIRPAPSAAGEPGRDELDAALPSTPGAPEPGDAGENDGEHRLAMLGEVVAGVAHELNNPLTTILGYAQLLQSLAGEEREQAVRTIEEEAQRAARTVRNLLSFARRGGRAAQPVDIELVLRRVAEVRRYSLEVENIRLETADLRSVPPVLADESRIEEVFLNLLTNAQRAVQSQGGGEIRVSTDARGDRVRAIIADTGPGVPPEMRSRIFEPFFTTHEVGEAQGMGLATVFGIVTEHHGRVWVEETPGGGASFIVEFSAAPGRHEDAAATVPAPGGRRILVVDDEAPIRALTREILGSEGYVVEAAVNGVEAIELLEASRYDLVVSDLRMPGMDGVELYEQLAGRWPEMRERVLFVTGDVEGNHSGRLAREQIRYLEKPFSTNALLQAVRDAIDAANRAASPGKTHQDGS